MGERGGGMGRGDGGRWRTTVVRKSPPPPVHLLPYWGALNDGRKGGGDGEGDGGGGASYTCIMQTGEHDWDKKRIKEKEKKHGYLHLFDVVFVDNVFSKIPLREEICYTWLKHAKERKQINNN